MRVLVVDDSAFMRKAISRMLDADPLIQVIDTARNGKQAVEKVKELEPDVITMDIEMPEMDGLEALETIMRECPTPVIMCSSLSTEGSQAALDALGKGAFDCVAKDASYISATILDLEDSLRNKVKAAYRNRRQIIQRRAAAKKPNAKRAARSKSKSTSAAGAGASCPEADFSILQDRSFDMVAIGSSTGGPPVVEKIIRSLPAGFKPTIVIAQHMPILFTRSLAERLDASSNIPVHHAQDDTVLERGHAYVLAGGAHGHIQRGSGGTIRIRMKPDPVELLYKPSATVLMETAAKVSGRKTLGIMLTGMGSDGLDGAKELVKAGGALLAQNESTCAVYGMPRAVIEAGLAHSSGTPDELVKALQMVYENQQPPYRAAS